VEYGTCFRGGVSHAPTQQRLSKMGDLYICPQSAIKFCVVIKLDERKIFTGSTTSPRDKNNVTRMLACDLLIIVYTFSFLSNLSDRDLNADATYDRRMGGRHVWTFKVKATDMCPFVRVMCSACFAARAAAFGPGHSPPISPLRRHCRR